VGDSKGKKTQLRGMAKLVDSFFRSRREFGVLRKRGARKASERSKRVHRQCFQGKGKELKWDS